MGYQELYMLLCPTIRHPLPPQVLARLQDQLHTLLKTLINDARLSSVLRFPEVSVLTELNNPLLRFPIFRQGILLWVCSVRLVNLSNAEITFRTSRYCSMAGNWWCGPFDIRTAVQTKSTSASVRRRRIRLKSRSLPRSEVKICRLCDVESSAERCWTHILRMVVAWSRSCEPNFPHLIEVFRTCLIPKLKRNSWGSA
jgi:hypothetical protein